MQSESLWKKQKSMLEDEASGISILKKQITKEAEIDVSVQSSINEKIQNLKVNATVLAKKLQNQKHKNAQLQIIIKHMKGSIEHQRIQSAVSRDNINSDNLVSLDNRFKKLQYDLGQINGKVNRMSENLEHQKHQISQNRTERVIDSGIFRNIEKELINSELTFKKLLIEKIKYQKEYQKMIQEYNELKDKAETYYCVKDTARSKTNKDSNPALQLDPADFAYKKKFLQVDTGRHKRYTTYAKIDDQIERQQEKQIISMKKLLIKTNLESCGELLHYFDNIEDTNEKYFNQINIYADQSNQIEKYLEAANSNKQTRMNFGHQKPSLTKQQLAVLVLNDKKTKVDEIKSQTDEQIQELVSLVESQHFKTLLQGLDIQQTPFIEDGYANFDALRQTLKLFDSAVSEYLRQPIKIQQQQNNTSRNTQGSQKLEDMISKVRKNEECFKVMKKQEFKEEYQKMIKSMTQKTLVGRSANKKKSFPSIRK